MLTTALLEKHKVKGSSPFLLHGLSYCEGPVYIIFFTAFILYPSQKNFLYCAFLLMLNLLLA